MLSESLLSSSPAEASYLSEAALRRLDAQQQRGEDEAAAVPAPLPAIEDILLPAAAALSPASSSTSSSSSSSSDEEPRPTSLLRYALTRGVFCYLLAFSAATFTLLSLSPSHSCGALLTTYLAGNGCIALLFALLLLYVNHYAPHDISNLATSSEVRAESIRWVAVTCVKQALGAVDFAFFILGHVAFFSAPSTCASTCPSLYAFTLTSLISGYLGFFLPLGVFLYLTYSYRSLIFRQRSPPGHYLPRPANSAELALVVDSAWEEGADEEDSVCAICYTDYDAGATISTLPCDPHHFFHHDCIHQWLAMRDSCPLCKARLKAALGKPTGGEGKRRRRRGRGGGVGAMADLVPVVLPGMAAASLAVTSVMGDRGEKGEREERKGRGVEVCAVPSPLDVGSPLRRGLLEGRECEEVVVSMRGEVDEEKVEEEVVPRREDARGEARRAAVYAAMARMAAAKEAQQRAAAEH